MCICRLSLVVEGTGYIKITHALNIIFGNIRTAPDNDSDLKLTVLLVTNLKLSIQRMFMMGNQIQPETN